MRGAAGTGLAFACLLLWPPGGPAPASGAAPVPMRVAGRVIFVKAAINGRGPFSLILDTGATHTVLTPPVVERLGVRVFPGATPTQRRASLESVTVGEAAVRNLPVYVFDPPQALPLRLDQGIDYHGLLGYSFLSQFVTTIDYAAGTVELEPVAVWRRRAVRGGAAAHEGAFEVPIRVTGRLIHADGGINGMGPLRFLVDTGSAEALVLPEVAARLGLRATPLTDQPSVGFVPAARVSLGGAVADGVPAIVHRLPDEAHARLSYHGILGHPFLSRFLVTISYADARIWLWPNAAAPASVGAKAGALPFAGAPGAVR